MRNSKRVISLLLCAIMVLTSFAVAAPMLLVESNAATTIDGVTQERVVEVENDAYKTTYDNYAAQYLNGASSPTNIVIPGLNAAQDYVIQGITYYAKRDWMLVTAYHNDGTESSKVFALDAATGEFVAMFSFLNLDGSPNMDHGGGIAISENNIYYSCGDKDRKIAYAPVSALENAPLGQHTEIQLVAEKDFVEIGSIDYDGKTAYTAYVCYDQGILWMGNFYDLGAKLLGVTIAAADYNAPSNDQYNSMVFGYELSGNSSAEEWANLTGATGKDCQGNPSYAIGLDNTLKDVQYAVVDNGKLYLSRSYGSGAGNSINFGFGDSSWLTVADIDLSVPGDTPVTISTQSTGSRDKTVMAYNIDNYNSYAMMPMSEGLCVVNDQIFVTFEGASNKYMNESSGLTSIGNCEKPVDVIWALDPYELMEITVAEPEKSIYYEKLHSLADIKDGDEYIIVYESDNRDPVTQKNYLYAFNADGNFSGHKLSKSSTDAIKGYDGMIGHPISHYSFEKGVYDEEILYLELPEQDDVESIRWTISKIPEQTDKYSIKSTATYFANNDSFFFDSKSISMMPSNSNYLKDISIGQLEDSSGYFYFSNKDNYLWCNDGTNATYNDKANAYYSANASNPTFDGVKETPGTFHCDAMNVSGSNILGGQIDTSDDDVLYEEGAFQIYRRVVDEVASTYESRVYTDLNAELQADGTYTVTLETFAISPNHYQYKGARSTDYIIVADTSSSMAEKGSTGINEYTGKLSVSSLSLEANTSDDNGIGVSGYGFSNPDEDIYFKHTDGKYYKAYMAVNTTELKKAIGIITKMRQKYYVYYVADDGLYYCVQDHAINPVGRTYTEWKAWVDSGENESDYSTKTSNANRRKEDVYVGLHYRFDDTNSAYNYEHVRLDTLKNVVNDLVSDIAAQDSGNRIALVKYGADAESGFITTSGALSTNAYSQAFWATGTVDQLKLKVNELTTSAQTNNSGIEFDYVNALIANSGYSYKVDGTRNVAVIFLTDGIPGQDGGSATTAAANTIISKALTAKNNGAFIYSVLIGNNEVGGFNKKGYMDGVSSKYAAAESLTSLGGMSVDGVNYAISLASTTMNNFVNFGAMTTEEVAQNTAVGLDNLDANSYLREQLNDAFKFPEGFDINKGVKVELVTGAYDEVGRFSFRDTPEEIAKNSGDATKIHCTTDIDNKTITVTNYHYAEEYVAKNRTTPGRKLRITISGLLADETKKIQNTSINNTETTGIYKTKGNMDNNVAFKNLPTSYFNIPEYTYVLDYGLPMYDSDINGTLKSVSADLSAQRDANGNLAYKDSSSNGLVKITNSNLDLLYTSTPTNFAESGYCLIQRDDGTYDWFEIKVVPASNVLYEEDYVKDKEGAAGVAWENVGTKTKEYQSLTNNDTDVYGYDDAYAVNKNSHSNNTVSKVSVSSTAKRSVPKTFDFVGEGFDLISACGANTGMLAVTVKDKTGKLVKGYLVDTYYNGDNRNDDIRNADGLACQTPIVSFKGDHDTYTVEVNALYLSTASALGKKVTGTNLANGKLNATTGVPVNEAEAAELLASVGLEELAAADLELVWFDNNSVLNGGTGATGNVKTNRAGETTTSLDCYVDGFRIYYPMSSEEAGYIAKEREATYHNVISCINENHIGTETTDLSGIAYVATDPTDETLTFANYQSFGPQNEFYLKANASDALVLKVQLPAPGSRVHLGLRAVTGTATVKIGATDFNVNGATEMYYDVTDCVEVDSLGVATITIQNTGLGILAVNNIKLTGDATMGVVVEEDMQDAKEYMMASPVRANVINGVVTPVEDDTTEGDSSTTIPGGDVVNKAPSFVQELLAKLFEILSSVFQFLPVGEVM